jgi:hypothetical protein
VLSRSNALAEYERFLDAAIAAAAVGRQTPARRRFGFRHRP